MDGQQLRYLAILILPLVLCGWPSTVNLSGGTPVVAGGGGPSLAGCDSASSSGGVNNIDVTTTAGNVNSGDLMLYFLCVDDEHYSPVNSPVRDSDAGAGWTQWVAWKSDVPTNYNGVPGLSVWYKTADSTDATGDTYNHNWSDLPELGNANTGGTQAAICIVADQDASPLGTTAENSTNNGSPVTPSISATADSLIIHTACHDSGLNEEVACPSGFTEGTACYRVGASVNGSTNLAMAWETHGSGSTTSRTFTADANDQSRGATLEVQ
jgi:hypothetical protein